MSLKSNILELKNQGKTYNEIAAITGASKGTISFHCSEKSKRRYYDYQNRRKAEFRQKLKLDRGGKCEICGYSKCLDALDFHHLDKTTKISGISYMSRSFKKAIAESLKCKLVCANCHREIHYLEKVALVGNEPTLDEA